MGVSGDSNSSSIPTLILFVAALLGFLLSNSVFSDSFHSFLQTKVSIEIGSWHVLKKNVLLFINDGLMAVFFLLIGLELKRELVVGELSEIKKASLPIFAALGGMLVPAFIYYLWNPTGSSSSGWGIPMATDIAFALGVLTVLGSRVPSSIKILLVAAAIVDDIGAIFVIALFYTSQIGWIYLLGAFSIFALCLLLNRLGVMRLSVYMFLGLPLWYFMLKSGVHATVAGVILATTIPLAPKSVSRGTLISNILNKTASPLDSPALFLEKSLLKWVSLIILPLFAFANSGVSLSSVSFGTISFGVMMGLFLGKPLGIVSFSWLACQFGLVSLPEKTKWIHVIGLGFLSGIGFTMSLFIASLAFSNQQDFEQAKLAVLIASLLSGIFGVLIFLNN